MILIKYYTHNNSRSQNCDLQFNSAASYYYPPRFKAFIKAASYLLLNELTFLLCFMTSSGQSFFDSSRSRRANDSNLIDLCLTIQTSSKGVRHSLKVPPALSLFIPSCGSS